MREYVECVRLWTIITSANSEQMQVIRESPTKRLKEINRKKVNSHRHSHLIHNETYIYFCIACNSATC